MTFSSIRTSTEAAAKMTLADLGESERSALRSGLISHGEHAVDLLLVQAALPGDPLLKGFFEVAKQLCDGVKNGRLDINEKIDGSPSIVLGYTDSGTPFVAYKGGLTRKSKQLIFTSLEDVNKAFPQENDARRLLYGSIVDNVLPGMLNLATQHRNFLFQADLLFFEGDNRRTSTDKEISITPNTITYKIDCNHPLYPAAAAASVGLAGHTISGKFTDPVSKRIEATAHYDPIQLQEFLQALNSGKVLALHPFHALTLPTSEYPRLNSQFESSCKRIEELFENITPEFRTLWREKLIAAFRVFNNSTLLPGADGGLFSKAANAEKFSARAYIKLFKDKVRARYLSFDKKDVRRREQGILLKAVGLAIREHLCPFESLISAYFEAIKLQHSLNQALKSSLGSKLGGGPVEGIMLSSGEIIVKWIDRLDFTRKNNEKWRGDGGTRWSEMQTLPEPFDRWKPGAIIFPMKLQPPHAGHIQMIRKVIEENPDKEIIILASDKEANLNACNWKELGLAPTKRDLVAGELYHPFSIEIRRELLQLALGKKVTIAITSTSIFRDYLRRAKESGEKGKIIVALGAKEKHSGRYDGDLKTYAGLMKPLYIALQQGGINGTTIRRAIRDSSINGCADSLNLLNEGLNYIPDEIRVSLIQRLQAEYRAAYAKANTILEAESAARTERKASQRKVAQKKK